MGAHSCCSPCPACCDLSRRRECWTHLCLSTLVAGGLAGTSDRYRVRSHARQTAYQLACHSALSVDRVCAVNGGRTRQQRRHVNAMRWTESPSKSGREAVQEQAGPVAGRGRRSGCSQPLLQSAASSMHILEQRQQPALEPSLPTHSQDRDASGLTKNMEQHAVATTHATVAKRPLNADAVSVRGLLGADACEVRRKPQP